MRLYYLVVCLITLTPPIRTSNDWNDPSKSQYHIQTDEGPERYFRYQTLSGQYRKEKRLEDGTVIGAYGWVDDDGFLRMRDYIADNAGYRILQTKNVFVGRNRPVSEALSIAKKVPGELGSSPYNAPTFSQPSIGLNTVSNTPRNSYNSPANVQRFQVGYSTEQLQPPVYKYATINLPTNSLAYSSTPNYNYLQYTPSVEVSPNAVPSSTESPIAFTTAVPSSTIQPPIHSTTQYPSSSIPTVYIPSTTSSPISSTSTPAYQSTTASYPIPISSTAGYVSSTAPPLPPIRSNNLLDTSLYSSDPQYEHYPETQQGFINPYIFQNGPTYPIDQQGHTYNGQNNNLGNGYDPQFPFYDGVSVTNDGFRYYIPKQYHEEQNLPGNVKSGSFGYVDPFGIRRVIYYNAGPDGFKHRKNNRYVGLNATPYDPRPY